MMLAMVSPMMLSIGDDVNNDGCHDDGNDVNKLLGDVIHDNNFIAMEWWTFTTRMMELYYLLVCARTQK